MADQESINKVITDIFALSSPKIAESRREQIKKFIEQSVNGDTFDSYLVVNANIGKNSSGVLVYILTNIKLIKIDIDEKNIESTSYNLNTIIKVERKLVEGNLSQISVYFHQNQYFGLSYSPTDSYITDFFQKVDQSRTRTKP